MKKTLTKIFIFLFLGTILIPIEVSIAASNSTQYYNVEGTRFTIVATIASNYPNDGSNLIQFEATLNQLRSDANDVHDLYVLFRIDSYDSGSTSLAPLSFVGDESHSSTYFDYSSNWGKVILQISVVWREDIPLAFDPIWSSNWITFFTLKPGNFFTENYYIFIIIGAVVIIAAVGITLGVRKGKRPKTSPPVMYPESTEVYEQQLGTKAIIYCPSCGNQLKEITQFCPGCGGKL